MGDVQEIRITVPGILIATIIMALVFVPIGFIIPFVGEVLLQEQKTEQMKHEADLYKWAAIITLYDRTPVPAPAKSESTGDTPE
jgi:hypothetical protein